LAADNLKIGQPEIKLSVFPPIALLIMPHLIGLKKAYELLLTGKVIEASEAERIGLINKVVPLASFETELEAFIQPLREFIEASEAERIGLINKVAPLASFETELEAFIQPLRELSLIGIKYSKKGIKLGLEASILKKRY